MQIYFIINVYYILWLSVFSCDAGGGQRGGRRDGGRGSGGYGNRGSSPRRNLKQESPREKSWTSAQSKWEQYNMSKQGGGKHGFIIGWQRRGGGV